MGDVFKIIDGSSKQKFDYTTNWVSKNFKIPSVVPSGSKRTTFWQWIKPELLVTL